jgi:hypothetical protein
MKNNKHTYKVFILLAAVIATVAVIDMAFGCFTRSYLSKHSLPGDYLKIDYLMNKADEDMIILGSSLPINALVPQIIEDSLGISCFNGGCSSQNFPFFQCMVECILNRYKPRCIVLAMRTQELAITDMGRFNLLTPYYHTGNTSIDYFLDQENGKKNIFLQSNLYRYNTIGWRILLSSIQSDDEIGQKGYMPHAVPKYAPILNDRSRYASYYRHLNPVNEQCYLKIIELCKQANVQLIVVLPPVYMKLPENGCPMEVRALEKLCKEHHVPFINDSQSSFFLQHPDLFYDNRHLNYQGAEVYTKMFISTLSLQKHSRFTFAD